MRKYEIMYILNPESSDIKGMQTKLHTILEVDGGKIVENGDWGVKDLLYPIKKKKKGYYVVLIVETNSSNIDEFIRISHIETDVLRTLVINTEKEKRYIQSTVFAKTEVKNDKVDRERKQWPRKFERRNDQRQESETGERTDTPAEAKNESQA